MIRAILVGIFLGGCVAFSFAQVTVTIPDTSANQGESITIPVNVNDLTGLGVIAYQFTVMFDEDVLDATGASSEGTLTASWGTPAVNLNNSGEIEVGGYTATDTLTGNGILVNLDFNVVGNIGESTYLKFSFFAIFNSEGALPADTSGATFTVNCITVVVATNIDSGTKIVVDSVTYPAPHLFYWSPGVCHSIGVISPQLDGAGVRYLFSSWGDGGAQTHCVSPVISTTYVAEMITQFYLTVDTTPPGLVALSGSGWYDLGDTVTIETAPSILMHDGKRYKFSGWVIDSLSVLGNPVSVSMDTPHVALANYEVVYLISGKVSLYGKGLSGTRIILSGDEKDTLFTDENGYYAFAGLPLGNYTITPEKIGVCFEPPSCSYAPLDSDYVNQNFTAVDILAPTVILQTPNGGESYIPGQQDTIRWIAADNVGVTCICLYFSSDGGQNWSAISVQEPNDSTFQWCVPEITSNSCRIKIIAYDHGGNFASDISDDDFSINPAAVQQGTNTTVPRVFSLSQNYPNPFVPIGETDFWLVKLADNPQTCIQYGLPHATKVKLEIFNLLGQSVRILKDEFQSSGCYAVYWDGRDENGNLLPSGVYVYQLVAEGVGTMRKKMMLLR